ncbi:cupin domain-containing protein [Nonomuraea terrae]|uniref:cupin domain-containing protein n=1 Tax=Nonomuraea terrae TaxID=2530383 RepID=UPI001CB71738|nr:cupin domain-containing protein [Nonomuraea terrae]
MAGRDQAGGEWALRFPAYQHVKIGALLSGSCLLTPDGGPALRLSEGGCSLLVGGRPYEVSSGPGLEPRDGQAVYRSAPSRRNRTPRPTSDRERSGAAAGLCRPAR